MWRPSSWLSSTSLHINIGYVRRFCFEHLFFPSFHVPCSSIFLNCIYFLKGLQNVDFRAPFSSELLEFCFFIHSSCVQLPVYWCPSKWQATIFASSLFITARMDGTVRFHDSRPTASPLLSLATNESKKYAASCVRLDSFQSNLAISTEIPNEGLFVVLLHTIVSSIPSASSSSSTLTISVPGYLQSWHAHNHLPMVIPMRTMTNHGRMVP